MQKMQDLYFDWMVDKVSNRVKKRRYSRLFHILHSRPFEYVLALDANRESDGIDLRYVFAYENDLDQAAVAKELDDKPCSFLEMLIAMSIRMDGMIFDEDPGLWFWDMMDSMGLSQWTNKEIEKDWFAEDDILLRIQRCMERDFDTNTGEGSPFTLEDNHGQNLCAIEFWCLAMWHTTEVAKVV